MKKIFLEKVKTANQDTSACTKIQGKTVFRTCKVFLNVKCSIVSKFN